MGGGNGGVGSRRRQAGRAPCVRTALTCCCMPHLRARAAAARAWQTLEKGARKSRERGQGKGSGPLRLSIAGAAVAKLSKRRATYCLRSGNDLSRFPDNGGRTRK